MKKNFRVIQESGDPKSTMEREMPGDPSVDIASSLVTQCPACKTQSRVVMNMRGRKGRCPNCGQSFIVESLVALSQNTVSAANLTSVLIEPDKPNTPLSGSPASTKPKRDYVGRYRITSTLVKVDSVSSIGPWIRN